MSKAKALLELLKAAAKYGSKVLKYIKAAFSTIWKYGTKAVTWVKNNIGKVVEAILIAPDVVDFIQWLVDKLEKLF